MLSMPVTLGMVLSLVDFLRRRFVVWADGMTDGGLHDFHRKSGILVRGLWVGWMR